MRHSIAHSCTHTTKQAAVEPAHLWIVRAARLSSTHSCESSGVRHSGPLLSQHTVMQGQQLATQSADGMTI